jgi:hypothetical protein
MQDSEVDEQAKGQFKDLFEKFAQVSESGWFGLLIRWSDPACAAVSW